MRMGIGRAHNKSKKPTVTVNGTSINVPDDWAGYDQANRNQFFGIIEVPVPMNLIKASNAITLNFPDPGGSVSSLILNVEKFKEGTGIVDHKINTQKMFDVYYKGGNTFIIHAAQLGQVTLKLYQWKQNVHVGEKYQSSLTGMSLLACGVYSLMLELNGKVVAQKNIVKQ